MIGFTGTQYGMNSHQMQTLRYILEHPHLFGNPDRELVHGDCTGSDSMADWIAADLGMKRYIFPSNIEHRRAYCDARGAIVCAPPSPPRRRNRNIVKACKILLAAPKAKEQLRSGTWMTVRIARELQRPIGIIMPEGPVVWEGLTP